MVARLLDTDVFVDHLRGVREVPSDRYSICLSLVTRCELFAGRVDDEEALRAWLSAFRELGLGRATAEVAGRIRREYGVQIADALIAATALEHDLTLLTRNRRDFERVPGLAVESPD